MNGYISAILVSSVVGGIINSLVPEKNGIKKYVKFIVGLVCIVSLISPITKIAFNANNIKEGVQNFVDNIIVKDKIEISNSLIVNTSAEKICEGVKEAIIDKYNFDEKEVFVDISLDTENINAIKVNAINVTLSGKSSWSDCEKIEEYLEGIVGCDITVKRR